MEMAEGVHKEVTRHKCCEMAAERPREETLDGAPSEPLPRYLRRDSALPPSSFDTARLGCRPLPSSRRSALPVVFVRSAV